MLPLLLHSYNKTECKLKSQLLKNNTDEHILLVLNCFIGTRAFVVLNGYQLIREAFITKGNDFAGRFAPYSRTFMF